MCVVRNSRLKTMELIKPFLISRVFIAIALTLQHFKLGKTDGLRDERVLRCVLANVPPFDLLTVYPNGSSFAIGASKTIAGWLAAKLKYSLIFVHPTEQEMKGGGNEAALNMVVNGKGDYLSVGYAITPARYARAEPATFPQWEEGYRMVVPRPGDQDRLFAFIKPFDSNVWLLFIVSFVAVSLFMGFATWANSCYISTKRNEQRIDRVTDYLGKYFLYNVNVITTHGDYLNDNGLSFLVGVSFWLLGVSVLVYGYSSIVVSSITLPKQLPSINTFEDVVAHPEISLIIRTDTAIGNAINSSSDVPLYNSLREKALKRPESVGNEGVINSTKLLLTGKYAYPFVETAVKYVVASQYVREGKCRFKLSQRLSMGNSYFYTYFQKGNKKLSREISIGTMALMETGLIRQWITTLPWIPRAEKCFAKDTRKTAKIASINLIDLGSAFFILGIGVGLSILTFLVEFIFSYRA